MLNKNVISGAAIQDCGTMLQNQVFTHWSEHALLLKVNTSKPYVCIVPVVQNKLKKKKECTFGERHVEIR